MAISLNWPVLSITEKPICIKFTQINGQPALSAKKLLDKRWPFKRGALYTQYLLTFFTPAHAF